MPGMECEKGVEKMTRSGLGQVQQKTPLRMNNLFRVKCSLELFLGVGGGGLDLRSISGDWTSDRVGSDSIDRRSYRRPAGCSWIIRVWRILLYIAPFLLRMVNSKGRPRQLGGCGRGAPTLNHINTHHFRSTDVSSLLWLCACESLLYQNVEMYGSE